MRLTVDANPFVSRFLEEDVHHAEALAFFDLCEVKSIELVVPVILLAEVSGAIARIRGEPVFAEAAVTRILGTALVSVCSLDLTLALDAVRLAARHQVRGADSFYLAVARETNSDLINRDGELLDVSFERRVITPTQWVRENS